MVNHFYLSEMRLVFSFMLMYFLQLYFQQMSYKFQIIPFYLLVSAWDDFLLYVKFLRIFEHVIFFSFTCPKKISKCQQIKYDKNIFVFLPNVGNLCLSIHVLIQFRVCNVVQSIFVIIITFPEKSPYPR